jgi:hypothetical protein
MFTEFQAEAGPLIPNPFPSFGGRIFYELFKDINIVLGMSGGPVWRVDANGQPIRNANGQPVAIGLHTSFINVQNGIESGMEMTEDLIELVNGWLKL